jgi:hypothetical protein
MLHAKSAVEGSRRAHKRCLDHCRAQWCRIGGMPLRQLHAVAQAVMRVDAGRAPTCKSCLLLYLSCSSILSDRDRSCVLDRTLGLSYAERSVHRQRSADGRSSRDRYRTACLRRIVGFSQFTATYAWTLPDCLGPEACLGPEPRAFGFAVHRYERVVIFQYPNN